MGAGNRTISIVNGTVATGLVLILAAVALVVNPPAPPGIAEFAPRATKPITKAPLGQAARAGRGSGACAAGQSCAVRPSPSATAGVSLPLPMPPASGVPSALQCYAWPDGSVTQTFDPQSPTCIAGWPGAAAGNGGSTSRGVTGIEIRVGVLRTTPATIAPYRALMDSFNKAFQLYGRQLVPVPIAMGATSPEYQRAAAARAREAGVFAAFDPETGGGLQSLDDGRSLADGMAKARVVYVAADQHEITSRQLRANGPYTWSYYPAFDEQQQALGQFYCRQLAGRPATHSAQFRLTQRKLAVLVPIADRNAGASFDDAALVAALATCHVTVRRVEVDTDRPDRLTADFVQLNAQGYTTAAFYLPDLGRTVAAQASNAGWHPEWLLPGLPTSQQGQFEYGGAPPDQVGAIFGLAVFDKILPGPQQPASVAARQSGLGEAHSQAYHALLLLAAGIQNAGARLTPEMFERGLAGADFPNPGAGAGPAFQDAVGFQDGGHVMRHGYAQVWFSPTERNTQVEGSRPGAFCWIARGRRWTAQSWPSGDPGFFTSRPCR